MKNTTNCKRVKELVRKHIMEYYTPAELKSEVDGIKCNCYPNDYAVVKYMAEGGCFLIYNNDIINFLNSLEINPNNKKFNVVDSFNLYCHLIARDAQLLLKNC